MVRLIVSSEILTAVPLAAFIYASHSGVAPIVDCFEQMVLPLKTRLSRSLSVHYLEYSHQVSAASSQA